MPILTLPVFEKEADPVERGLSEEDLQVYAKLTPPETVVVKYGFAGMIGEFPCSLDRAPGCGTKFVVSTPRGTEIGEMLTTTCSNAGCGKSITRREMLDYIENSGGRQYPFTTRGRVLRLATAEDLARMSALNDGRRALLKRVREVVAEIGLSMKVVEVEPILGEEVLTVHFMAERRVDFRELVRLLSGEFSTRIDMRQVGAREEARLTADYERCGQHCCCKQFLKVLKPVSMKSAKMQKGTLDPLKISGRCGRLMCCLRYEDATYMELKQRLPHRRTRVGTPDGPGIVLDSQILTQLVLVELERDGKQVAVPVEQLIDPEEAAALLAEREAKEARERSMGFQPVRQDDSQEDALRGLSEDEVARRAGLDETEAQRGERKRRRRQERHRGKSKREGVIDGALESGDADETREPMGKSTGETTGESAGKTAASESDDAAKQRRKRRGRRGKKRRGPAEAGDGQPPVKGPLPESADGAAKKKQKRRRGGRRRRKPRSDGPPSEGD